MRAPSLIEVVVHGSYSHLLDNRQRGWGDFGQDRSRLNDQWLCKNPQVVSLVIHVVFFVFKRVLLDDALSGGF